MTSRQTRNAVTWLLLVFAGCAALFVGVYAVFVRTARGQLVDQAALNGSQIGRTRILDHVNEVLDLVSVVSLVSATLLIAVIALLRRRPGLAALVVLFVAGTNLSTRVLKFTVLDRPDLGIYDFGLSHRNTLPSGHTTVAMSLAVAIVLVVPPRIRGLVALLGAGYGAVTGVSTLAAGWHRPSDAIAACLVVGAWAAALGAGAAAVSPPDPDRGSARAAHPIVSSLLLLGALGCLAVGVCAMLVTAADVPADLSRARLFLAYAGGAASIAGSAFAVMAALLVVIHRVVPAGAWSSGSGTVAEPGSPVHRASAQ